MLKSLQSSDKVTIRLSECKQGTKSHKLKLEQKRKQCKYYGGVKYHIN